MTSDGVDRISSLPDPILHHIFSYLETRKLVQTSILSNRWRYLWTSTPYLSFHHQYVSTDATDYGTAQRVQRDDFMSFVDQVFLGREDSNIHKLTLTCNMVLRASRLYEWLNAASKQHVHELSLEVYTKKPLDVPHEFFTPGITKVKIINYSYVGMRMPISMCSSATIKSLYLYGVKLPNGTPNGELTFSCPILEDLVIHNCDPHHPNGLTILAPLLKRLGLFSKGFPFRTISICCPNLTSLKYKSWMFSDWSAENLLALTSAHIDVYGVNTMTEQVPTRYLTNVLKGVRNVKALTISVSVLKIIDDSPDIMEMLPNLFHNMTDFMLDEGFNGSASAIMIANLLKRLPGIEAFVWKRDQYYGALRSTARVKNLEANMPVERKFYRLKTVEIRNFHGMEDELKFLEFILETYVVLKEMIIVTTTLDKKKLLEFKEKLLALPRASKSFLIHCRGA